MLSGLAVKNWTTIGRSFSVKYNSPLNFSGPTAQIPSAEINSVKKTSGLFTLSLVEVPVSMITCLNAQSVTLAIGAKIVKGFLSFCHKVFCMEIKLSHHFL